MSRLLSQLHVLGELVEAIGGRGNLEHRSERALAGRGLPAEILLDRRHELPGGFQFGQDFFGKAAAEFLFQRGDDLHPLQRIHAGLDDRRIERHAVGPLLGHAADFLDHQLREMLVQGVGDGRSCRADGGRGAARLHRDFHGLRHWPATHSAAARRFL